MIHPTRRDAIRFGAGLAAAALTPAVQAEEAAIKKPIPHTKEMLPVVGLGTANRWGDNDRGDLTKVLQSLVAGGGSLVDTASTYGSAETVLGGLLTEAKVRERIFLATKMEAENAAEGRPEFQSSLQKLRTPKVELMQLHNVGKANQSLAYLRDFKVQGVCRYIGITSTFPRDFAAMEAVIKREKPDFVQVNYSLGDRGAEARILPACADAGSAVLTALPFGRSSLFGKVRGKDLPDWAKEFDAKSWAQFFLKYLIGHPAVTAVIPGTNKADHMVDNLGAGRGRLPDVAMRKRMVEFFTAL